MSETRRQLASAEGLTMGDIRSLVRWFRSVYGPLCAEAEVGSLTLIDTDDPIHFRMLLRLLDGPEGNLKRIDIFGSERSIHETRALFSAYRRLRRMERRLDEHNRRVWHGQGDDCHAVVPSPAQTTDGGLP